MRVLASVTPFLTERPTSSSTRILLVNLPLARYEARKSPSLWTIATQPREPSSYWIASPVLGFVPFVRVLASVTPFPTEKLASASTRILLVNLPLSRYTTRTLPSLRDWTALPRGLSLFLVASPVLGSAWFVRVLASPNPFPTETPPFHPTRATPRVMKLGARDVAFGSDYTPTIKFFSIQGRLAPFPCSYESLLRDESARRQGPRRRFEMALRITARMYIGTPSGCLGLRGAAARRSATWPFALVGLRATSHTCDSLYAIALNVLAILN